MFDFYSFKYILIYIIQDYELHYASWDIDAKNWSFIKRHTTRHLFDDIEAKGVTANTDTRTFEKKHGPIRDIYQNQTNFKNVAPQVLFIDKS